MTEPRGTLFFIKDRLLPCHRKEGELPIVIDPWTGLMRLLDPSNFVRLIAVLPAISHLSRLGSPAVHPPWARDNWVGVPGTEVEGTL